MSLEYKKRFQINSAIVFLRLDFHSCIDFDDYDVKKLVIMELFKLDSSDFIDLMGYVLKDKEKAKKEIKYIVKDIRNKIINYQFDQDLPDIDLSELGL